MEKDIKTEDKKLNDHQNPSTGNKRIRFAERKLPIKISKPRKWCLERERTHKSKNKKKSEENRDPNREKKVKNKTQKQFSFFFLICIKMKTKGPPKRLNNPTNWGRN